METIEIRCPVGPKRLLAKARLMGAEPNVTDENLIEFSCDDCKRRMRQAGKPVVRVLHRYNLLGELIESQVE